jgi:hypothetical protein
MRRPWNRPPLEAITYNLHVRGSHAAERKGVLSEDTAADIEQRQIERWRRMSPMEKMALVSAASRAVRQLAEAGIRERYPNASERERFLRYAILTLGRELAETVYPDAADLSDA